MSSNGSDHCHSRHLDHSAHQLECCDHVHGVEVPAAQSLAELEFERGIWQAAIDGNLDKLQRLIGSGHLHDKDAYEYTALHYASRANQIQCVKALLRAGIDVNAQSKGGATALQRAAYCGFEEVLSLLLDAGAKLELTDADGRNALHKAYEGGNSETAVKLLLEHATEQVKNSLDRKGKRPEDYAI